MLTHVIIPMFDGPPYEFYEAECDCCGLQYPERIKKWAGEAHVLPEGWTMQVTARSNWPAIVYDQCPVCTTAKALPSPKWEASWAPHKSLPVQDAGSNEPEGQ